MRYRIVGNIRSKITPVKAILIAALFLVTVSFFAIPALRGSARIAMDKAIVPLEKTACAILNVSYPVTLQENIVYTGNGSVTQVFSPELRYKKIVLVIMLLVLIFPGKLKRKLFISIALVSAWLFTNLFYIACGIMFSSNGTYSAALMSVPDTIALVILFTFLFLWYAYNRDSITGALEELGIGSAFLKEKDLQLMIALYIYIIGSRFILEYFDHGWWINFLFSSAGSILNKAGYHAEVEPFFLVGDNGSIYMAKYCLGIKTMLVFAIFIYLTGKNNKARWYYLGAGLILLNIVNILRFVFLFIHIQKHGDYKLAISVHDMYNYITYTFVFILWIIWIEFFSELRRKRQQVL